MSKTSQRKHSAFKLGYDDGAAGKKKRTTIARVLSSRYRLGHYIGTLKRSGKLYKREASLKVAGIDFNETQINYIGSPRREGKSYKRTKDLSLD